MPYAGSLRELGLFIPKGAHFVVPAISELVEDADSDLPDVLRPHLRDACSEIRELKDKCAGIEHELKALAKQLPEVQRLLTIPGIGLLTATAIVGFVGDLRRFPSGRRFSSYLGLVPKENSSGDIRRLGRITKRGDSYLRTLLTQGGRAVLRAANVSKSPPDKLRAWARRCCTARSKSLTSLCRLQSHPAQYVSGIPSAAILLSISHPIRCSTRCLANVRARISGPMIAL